MFDIFRYRRQFLISFGSHAGILLALMIMPGCPHRSSQAVVEEVSFMPGEQTASIGEEIPSPKEPAESPKASPPEPAKTEAKEKTAPEAAPSELKDKAPAAKPPAKPVQQLVPKKKVAQPYTSDDLKKRLEQKLIGTNEPPVGSANP